MYDEYKARGFDAKTLWAFDNIVTIKYYASQYNYTHFEDRGRAAWNLYRIAGYVPLNYVVDTAGIVIGGMEGFTESTIRAWIESSLPPLGIEENKVIQKIDLLSVEPSLTNTRTNIKFNLTKAGHAVARIYATSGKLVKTMFDVNLSAGVHNFNWDLKDDAGYSVANGIYLYELTTGSVSARTKISVLR